MDPVLKRSLWLLVGSAALVILAVFFGLPDPSAHPQHGSSAPTGEVGFIALMIPHHQEAITSAEALLAVSERPEMRALAQDVIRAQRREVATLKSWLAAWHPNVPAAAYAPMMRGIASLNPQEAERVFLEDMLMHHDMALDMARRYLAGDGQKRPEVAALAHEILSVQDAENEQMRAWLESWYGASPAHGH